MAGLLVLVPWLGRRPLIEASLDAETLADRAVAFAVQVADDVVVVDDQSSPERLPADVDRLRLPTDLQALTDRLARADRVAVHDPLCPLVPGSFVAQLLADETFAVCVAVHPVIDTLKATHDHLVTGTVDRERFRLVSSPLIAPGALLAELDGLAGGLSDLAILVAKLRARVDVELVTAPPLARRIADASDLRLLAALAAQPPGPEVQDERSSLV